MQIGGAVVANAIDEERGRALDAALAATFDAGPHVRRVEAAAEVAGEAIGVEPDFPRVVDDRGRTEIGRVRVQNVVHVPEAALRVGGFGGFRGPFGVTVNVDERKVTVDVTKAGAELLAKLLNDGICGGAIGAFVIAVMDKNVGGVQGPEVVVPLVSGRNQFDHEEDRAVAAPPCERRQSGFGPCYFSFTGSAGRAGSLPGLVFMRANTSATARSSCGSLP